MDAAPAPAPRTAGRSRGSALVATIATIGSAVLVALLASRPESPLTPDLAPGAEAPGILARGAAILGLDRLPRDIAAVASAVFFVAAAAAFVYALREAWHGRLTLRRILLVALALHALAIAVPLFLSRDVYSYAIYGRMVSIHGANPYVDIPANFTSDRMYALVSVDWIDSPSVYGPGFTALSAGITAMIRSPAATVLSFKVVAALASVGTMVLVAVAAHRVRPDRAAFAAALVGWNPVVVFHGVGGGHNDALVGLALAGAAVLILGRRELLGTAVLALGTLVKVSGGVPLALAVAAAAISRPKGGRLRTLAAHAGVALAVALPFVAPFMQAEDPSLGALELTSRQGWLAQARFVVVLLRGAARFLGGPVAGDVVSVLVRLAFPAVFLVVVVAMVRHLAREPSRVDPALVVGIMGWGVLLALLTAPLLYPWYVAWLVPVVWPLPRPARDGAVVVCVALAVTELLAEPSRAPGVWEAMVFGLHYVATPIVLGVLVRLLLELRRRMALGPATGWDDPLLADDPRSLVADERPSAAPGSAARGAGRSRGGDVAGAPEDAHRRKP